MKKAFILRYLNLKYNIEKSYGKIPYKDYLKKIRDAYYKEYAKDNFKTMDNLYKSSQKDVMQVIEDTRKSTKYLNYHKKEVKKVQSYKFNFKDVYDPSRDVFMKILEKEFNDFKKQF